MVEGAQLCTTGNLLISLSVYICRCVLQSCSPLYLQWVQEESAEQNEKLLQSLPGVCVALQVLFDVPEEVMLRQKQRST